MNRGLDANQSLATVAHCIVKSGYTFVCRYLKEVASGLTRGEAEALSTAGLYIVAIVERGYPIHPGYFSGERGKEDSAFALGRAQAIGIPATAPIYYAVDYDASGDDVKGIVTDYFRAIRLGGGTHPVGVYGSGLVCHHLVQSGLASYAWLSMSQGWRGTPGFQGWNLRQTAPGTVCGVNVDINESKGQGGGWRL